ncbi:hypothetical protein [uncultured Porphyromonas sp.]|uniref:hypothetical protein n=1 Tax=uncultured Porphyromonas sp. TaxID=159274 RepID=UPI0035A8E08E
MPLRLPIRRVYFIGLSHGIVPFIITDELKMYYYRGLEHWEQTPGYLIDTCLTAQDQYKALLTYFRIKWVE